MKRIVVLGAGFAGLIAAVGAVRKLTELHISRDEISVTVVNRDPWHSIRVRNYESDLSDVRVPLDAVLRPIGVLTYDGLVFALGSELIRPEFVHWRVSGRNPSRWNSIVPQPPATEQSGTSDCHSGIFRI